MKKVLLLGAFVFIGAYGYAQTENENEVEVTESQSESADHGTMVSDLAQTTTETGQAKGAMISSAARAKAMTTANSNAQFIRGEAKPDNAGGKPDALPSNANAMASSAPNGTTPNVPDGITTGVPDGVTSGKPETLPPVTPPTTGKPEITPVAKPDAVPVGGKPASLPNGN